jgi:hypothetical protein
MLGGALAALAPIVLLLISPEFIAVSWIHLPEAIATVGLGIAVFRSGGSSIRRSLAAVLLLNAAARIGRLFLDGGPPWEAWWVSLTVAMALGTVSAGVWRAREWGRWSCVILGVVLWAEELTSTAYRLMISMTSGLRGNATEMVIGWSVAVMLMAIPLVALMVYGVLPSTRSHFAEARDAIARPRAVPG